MFELLLLMLERLGLIVMLAFIATRLRFFSKHGLFKPFNEETQRDRCVILWFLWNYWNVFRSNLSP